MGEPRLAAVVRIFGRARLVHPFPSLLDAVVTTGLALVAGAPPTNALRAGGAMLLLQFAIGAVNDVADAPADAVAAPTKPIPAGLVEAGTARRLAIAAAIGGLALAVPAGPAALAVAGAGLAVGLAYDLRLKGTAWSWLPYALGVPLLLVFAWVGTGLMPPAAVLVLAPVAAVAGAELAIANALADLDRDRRAGVSTVATRLGRRDAGRLVALLATVVVVAAWFTLFALGGSGAGLPVVFAGSIILGLGATLSSRPPLRARRRAWEIQAIGLALIGVGWTAALVAAGRI